MICGQPDLAAAIAQFGPGEWIDLSTTVTRRDWPVPECPESIPQPEAQEALIAAASARFGCDAARILPVPSLTAATRAIAQLLPRGRAAVIGISGTTLRGAGWQVDQVAELAGMRGADLAVITNPDSREWAPQTLRELAKEVGQLLIDERFADPRPDLSLTGCARENTLILRSLRHFWALPGPGLVIGNPALLEGIARTLPPVSPTTLWHGAQALADRDWSNDLTIYLTEASLRLDQLGLRAGWKPAGGTHLFRLFQMPNPDAALQMLARGHIWARRLPDGLRLSVPGNHDEWDRLRDLLRR